MMATLSSIQKSMPALKAEPVMPTSPVCTMAKDTSCLLYTSLLFSDGRYAGGMLDRNGLRPARYTITKNDMMRCV